MDREIKKLKLQVEYLRLELEEVRELNLKCQSKFNQDFAEELSKYNKPKKQKKSKDEISEEEEHKISPKPDETTLKLFKDIAVKTHPDKKLTETDELFVKANEAKENNDLSALIDIAEKLNIDVSEYVNDPKLLEEHGKEMTAEIQNTKSQMAWIWYHAKDEERESLRHIILNHIKSVS